MSLKKSIPLILITVIIIVGVVSAFQYSETKFHNPTSVTENLPSSIPEKITPFALPTTEKSTPPQAQTSVKENRPIVAATTTISWDTVTTLTKASVVNIFCTNVLSPDPETGSGVIIDSRGVILTNAHVAIDLLLKKHAADGNVKCIVRTGDPAQPAYNASLLYISPSWITKHASYVMWDESAGWSIQDDDYALVLITTPVKNSTQTVFPFLLLDDRATYNPHEKFLLAGYPAEFLERQAKFDKLKLVTSITEVMNASTTQDKVDKLRFTGTSISQWGASGGPVVSSEGKVVGLTTLGNDRNEKNAEKRILDAYPVSRFLVAFKQESGESLQQFLAKDLKASVAQFEKGKGQELEDILNKIIQERVGAR
jgi:hypothetical protein